MNMLYLTLFDLPWKTLVTLASGYISYFIANVGLKDHHELIDIFFFTLIFSLLLTATYHVILWYCSQFLYGNVIVSIIGIDPRCGSWRKYERKRLYAFFCKQNILVVWWVLHFDYQ